MRGLLWAWAMTWFCCFVGNAQTIYSNNFSLGPAVNITNIPPAVANTYAGGTGSALWLDAGGAGDTNAFYADGTVGTAQGDSILLPFFPQSGYVYTLTFSVTFTGNPGSWIGAGFAQYYAVPGIGNAQLNQSGVNGYDWAILTESTGNVQYFAGPSGAGPIFNQNNFFTAGTGTHMLTLTLDTTASQWVIACYVDGIQAGANHTNASEPIAAIGLTQHALTTAGQVRWNSLVLQAVGPGPMTNTVNATVNFSATNSGVPLNPAYGGLSYEKSKMTTPGFFSATNTALINLFSLIGPAVLRIGGGTVDTTGWNGISNTYPITASEVDDLAGFMKALLGNWKVIYGIGLYSNTPANAAAEAAYAANDLGTNLLGFEIGNEPEYGFSSYSAYLARWRLLAAAITNAVPRWAITNGGDGWIFADTDAGQGQLSAYTDPFARDESGVVSLLTQHYYRAGPSTNDTMQLLLQPDSFLHTLVTNIVGAADDHCPLGARITECGSYSGGGTAGVSDAYGAALWTLDFMFTTALNGGAGINFHGGGKSPYSPLIDNGPVVTRIGPEFYGLKMFSMLPRGNVVPAAITLSSNINFTAYGVQQANGRGVSVLLNNKDSSAAVAVSANPGPDVTAAQLVELTGPALYNTSGFLINGAPINLDGSWAGGTEEMLTATNGQLTVTMPPASAFLLIPVVSSPQIAVSLNSSQLTLNWPTNYIGWLLQSNSMGLATTNWFPVAGSSNTNRVQIPIGPGQSNVFYRLSIL